MSNTKLIQNLKCVLSELECINTVTLAARGLSEEANHIGQTRVMLDQWIERIASSSAGADVRDYNAGLEAKVELLHVAMCNAVMSLTQGATWLET